MASVFRNHNKKIKTNNQIKNSKPKQKNPNVPHRPRGVGQNGKFPQVISDAFTHRREIFVNDGNGLLLRLSQCLAHKQKDYECQNLIVRVDTMSEMSE